jgi:uncharacterized protein
MLLKISDLEQGKVRFSETFVPGAIDFFEPQLRQEDPLEASGTAELSEATREILVGGHLKTRMEIACDRCLEPAVLPVEADFSLLYRPASSSPEHGEVLLHGPEVEVGFYEGEGLELSDVLREQVLLLLPMQRVCREDCKGICPVCGQNRNQMECRCHQEPADDRWSGLRDLKTDPIK